MSATVSTACRRSDRYLSHSDVHKAIQVQQFHTDADRVTILLRGDCRRVL